MEKAEKTFLAFCEAGRKDKELWNKLSQIMEFDAIKKFFEELQISIEDEHAEMILEINKGRKNNSSMASDKDYY
jgi:hypothetical protein